MPDNFHLVEGPYKNVTIRRVRPEDEEKVCEHLKLYFLRDEPTSKLLGYTEEYGNEFCNIVKHYLPHNMSFWMEDNETGDVAAVRATFAHRKKDDFFDNFPRNSKTIEILFRLNDIVLQKGNLFERYGIEEYADFLAASTNPKYRNQGLAKELYRRSLIFLKAEGFKLAKSMFTSQYTRAAVRSLGFEEIARCEYKDVRDDDGNLIFDPKVLNDEHYGSLMVKEL